jgi:hypothetical protein
MLDKFLYVSNIPRPNSVLFVLSIFLTSGSSEEEHKFSFFLVIFGVVIFPLMFLIGWFTSLDCAACG